MENALDFNNSDIFDSPLNSCPLCSSGNISNLHIISSYKPPFKVDQCSDCKFIFMNPRFNDKTLSNMYNNEYYSGAAEYSYYDERKAEKFSNYVWDQRLKTIRKYVKNGNFLDIGCSFGGLLKRASEFFTPFGVDLSEYSGKHAKELFGNNIHIGSLDSHAFDHDFFSVVTMIELIEHVADPVSLIEESYKLLKQDGLLLVQTANMNAMQAKLLKDNYAMYMPGHLSYFSMRNLTDLLRQTGFHKIKVYYPVEFGLLPKLQKSRYSFKSAFDYFKWLRISYYHFISKIRLGNFAATSSMVVYAVK